MPVIRMNKIPDIMRDIVAFADLRSEIGFFGQGSYPNGTRVVDVAFWNEFGTKRIPARSFIRGAMLEAQDEMAKFIGEQATLVASGVLSPEQAHRNIGAKGAKLVKSRIDKTRSWAKPNAPSTLARKGSSKPPLHDTERLSRSVSYVVRDNMGRFRARGKPSG